MASLIKIIDDDIILSELVKRDQYLEVVNADPPESWIKTHPTANVKYLPIEKHELLLTRIFQEWYVEVLDTKQIMNSIVVTVRVNYRDPIDREIHYQEGVGAVPVQTTKGAKASDMSSILSDGVMKATPSAESYAIKDACEKIGKIFGKDLNRRDVLGFTPTYNKEDEKKKIRENHENS